MHGHINVVRPYPAAAPVIPKNRGGSFAEQPDVVAVVQVANKAGWCQVESLFFTHVLKGMLV